MKTYVEQLDYNDLQTIVAEARLQRSLAAGDAISGLMAAARSGLRRAVNALKSSKCNSGLSPVRRGDPAG